MRKIGLFVKVDERVSRKADEFESWLTSRGVTVIRKQTLHPSRKLSERSISFAPPDLFCIFVFGGDGTFLSAARWIGEHPIPIIGVKFGEVGFLAETGEDVIFPTAEAILNNRFKITPRMRLLVRVMRRGNEIVKESVLK